MKGSERARRLLDEAAAEFAQILGGKLVGIYEHGSLAFGCFNWDVSDIDFLAVVREKPTQEEKEALIRVLLDRTADAPDKGFEMSVVLEKDLSPFVYPTPFELHFSGAHLEACRKNLSAYCAGMNGVDRDLAAHCMVIAAVGRTVMGAEIAETFGRVPMLAYLDSIWYDVENAEDEAEQNPVYMILNLCRVLAAAREGLVLSKQDGGRWGMRRLEKEWRKTAEEALHAYETGGMCGIGPEEAKKFARHMLVQINTCKQTGVCN